MLSNLGYAVAHPLEEMRQMTRRMEEMMGQMNVAGYHPFQGWTPREQQQQMMGGTDASMREWGWRPKMDVLESEINFKVLLELPGWTKEDLDVQLNGRYLSITGKRGPMPSEEKHMGERWTYWRRERYSEKFHRAVALPEGIDGENITAIFKEGLLQLIIPKHGGKLSQRVAVFGSEEHEALDDIHHMEELERQRRMNRGEFDRKAARKLFEMMKSNIGNYPRLKHVSTQEKKTFAIDTATSRPKATRRSWKWLDRMEEQERIRRIRQGDLDRNASKKLFDVVRTGGITGGAMHLHKSGWHDIDRMEEQERKRRTQQGDMDKQAARKMLDAFRTGTSRGLPQLKKTTTRRISISNIATNIRSQKNLQDVNRLEEQERTRRIQQGETDKQASEKLLKVVKEGQPPQLHHVDARRRNVNITGPTAQ